MHQTWHINHLELEAVYLALRHFLSAVQGRQVLVRTDNTAVVSYINRQGGLQSLTLHAGVWRLLLWAQSVLLVAPHWPQRPWMAEVHELLDECPWRLSTRPDLLSQAQGRMWHPQPESLNLHVWPLNGSAGAHLD